MARLLQSTLAWLSTQTMKHIIATNSVKNSPVTINDIDRAEFIYGPAMTILQGKMTRDTTS